MAAYKLSYFNLRARAECSRLLFAVAGVKYEDHRIDRTKEWPTLKPTTPQGHVPLLTVNTTVIPQSRAIERYLAREFGLYGINNMENTMCDVVVETISDVRREVRKYFTETDGTKKEELNKSLSAEVMPKFTAFMEKVLKENGGQYLVGNKISWADLALFDILEQIIIMWSDGVLAYSVEVKNHFERIKAVPRVKTWLENRPQTDR